MLEVLDGAAAEPRPATSKPGIDPMKISARNVLEGTVIKVTKGATTAHVVLEVAGGAKVTASITNEAVDDLDLKVGDKAKAVVKASDVLVAVD
jgi:molybdopterin-binding protein